MLVAWLLMKVRHFTGATGADRRNLCFGVLANLSTTVRHGTTLLQVCPSLTVKGCILQVSNTGHVDLSGLAAVYPTWMDDWIAIRLDGGSRLEDCMRTQVVQLGSLLMFLEARVHHSSVPLPAGHWLVRFRNTTLKVVAFLLEVAIVDRLETSADSVAPVVPDILGKSGVRRQRTTLVSKCRIIDKYIENFGSGNVVVDTLVSGHKGYAGMLAALANDAYMGETSTTLQVCNLASCNWDGGSYGGFPVNAGYCSDTLSNFAAYFKPLTAPLYCILIRFSVG